jgi:hypothetical protein
MRVRIKKAPKRSDDRWRMTGDSGLPASGMQASLPKAQDGAVVDHFKNEMLKRYGKYLVTDKGANRTYYGYPGPDGKMIENNFEVLTGKSGDSDYYSPYSLEETEKKPLAFQEKIRTTPVGSFPISYNANLYGSPGLNIENSNGLAMHATYNPEVRNAYFNNNNPYDNYASYGCINCHKPDVARVLKGFGANDNINIIDSRKSVQENMSLGRDNRYLFNHPEAARMLFEDPRAHFVRRQWNGEKGVYEGTDTDYNPYSDAIIEKKELAPVTVVGRRNKPKNTYEASAPSAPSFPAGQNSSVVDYLNSRGIDSSRVNRLNLAHDLGIEDYNYRAEDNIKLLRELQEREKQSGSEGRMRMGGERGEWGMGNGVVGENTNNGAIRAYKAGGAVGLNRTMGPVHRMDANIEAERGETVMGDFDDDGGLEHLAIGGKPHSQGGTPLSVPDGSFIFSKTRSLKIGGPVLAEFGKNANTKKKFTPAELAKQYDLNRYKQLLQQPDIDPLTAKTAALMADKYQDKLSKLALLQEAMKGFPQGVPQIAMPAMQKMVGKQEDNGGQMTDDSAGRDERGQMPITDHADHADMNSDAVARGGPGLTGGEGMPMAQMGLWKTPGNVQNDWRAPLRLATSTAPGSVQDDWRAPLMLAANSAVIPPWFKLWTKSNTAKGSISPTGRSTVYDPTQGNNIYDDYRYWSGMANRPFTNAKDYQNFVYHQVQKHDPEAVGRMWGDYGLTSAGIANSEDPNWGFDDQIFGARTAELSHWRPGPAPATIQPTVQTPAPVVPAPSTPKDDASKNKKDTAKDRWWPQDKINVGAAFMNRYDLQKYMPTYVGMNAMLPNATFFDPTRQLAANQEAAAQQNMMSALYAGPQRLRAVGSNIQGQGASNAANVLAQVQNQNVGVANQFAGVRAEILNNVGLQNRNALSKYLDQNTIANQQYDNAVRLANNDIRTNTVSGMTNEQKTRLMNQLNPYYRINVDPRQGPVGGAIFKTGSGKGIKAPTANSYAENPLSTYKTYLEQYNTAFPSQANSDRAYAFAEKMALGNKSRYGVDSDGDASMSMSGYMMSPQAQQMALMGMYGQ